MHNLTTVLCFNVLWKKRFQLFMVTWSSLSMFRTFNDLSVLLNIFSLFVSRVSRAFLLCMFGIMVVVLEWIFHVTLVYSVVLDDCQLSFILPSCFSVELDVKFCDLPKYLRLHERANKHTPGWLLFIRFGLYSHRMFCTFLLYVKVMLLFSFLNLFLVFYPILGTHPTFLELF